MTPISLNGEILSAIQKRFAASKLRDCAHHVGDMGDRKPEFQKLGRVPIDQLIGQYLRIRRSGPFSGQSTFGKRSVYSEVQLPKESSTTVQRTML